MLKVKIQVMIIFCLSFHSLGKTYTFTELLKMAQKQNIEQKIDEVELHKTESKLKSAQSENYPELFGVLGGESRRTLDDGESSVNTEKLIAEMRVHYNIYKFGGTLKKVKALEEIKQAQSKKLDLSAFLFEKKFERFYVNALYHKRIVEILGDELAFNKTLVSLVRKKEKSGLTGKADFLDVRMRESNLESELLSNEANYDEALERLRWFAQIPIKESIELNGELKVGKADFSKKEVVEKAKSFNREYQEAKSQMSASRYELASLKASNLPQINLKARFGRMRIDETYTSENSLEGLAGIYVDIPIWDGGKRESQAELQRLKASKKELEFQRVVRDLEVEVSHELHKLKNALKQIELSEKSLKASREYYRNVLSEYKRGIKSSMDLISARDRLANFQKSLVKFKMHFITSRLNLQEMTGLSF